MFNYKHGLINLLIWSMVTANVPIVAQADTMGASSYSPFTSITPQTTAPTLQANTAGLVGLYSSCFGGTGTSAKSIADSINQLAGHGSGGSGKTGSCSMVDANKCSPAIANATPSCPENSSDIDAVFKKAIGDTNTADCCILARENQLQSATNELSCIAQQNQQLSAQIKALQTTFSQNLATAAKYTAQIDQVMTDRFHQNDFLDGKLKGANGKPGLLALQQKLAQLVDSGQMDQAVQGLQQQVTNYNFAQQDFQQRVQNQKMALAQACMKDSSRTRCTTNAKTTCSYLDWLEAKYYAAQRTVNGQTQFGNTGNQSSAQSNKAALDALFGQIFSNMESSTYLAPVTDAQKLNAQNTATNNYSINNPTDLLNQYGSSLAGFNTSSFPLEQDFLALFQQCYTQAQTTINVSMQKTTSQYGQSMKVFADQKTAIQNAFKTFYTQNAAIYQQIWDAFGQTAALDTTACASTSVLSQMNQCATDLATNIKGLYTGTGANSGVTIAVPGSSVTSGLAGTNGTTGSTAFGFQCYGINGCITKIQNAESAIQTDINNQYKAKISYIQNVNAQIDNMKNQVRDALSMQSQQLSTQITALGRVLASNGITGQFAPTYLQPQDPWPKGSTLGPDRQPQDGNGLYGMPKDFLGSIGGDIHPPLIDPTTNSFEGVRTGIAQAIQDDTQKDSDAKTLVDTLTRREKECLKGSGYRAVAKLEEKFSQMDKVCATADPKAFCGQVEPSLAQAISATQAMYPDVSLNTNGLTALENGISTDCGKSISQQTALQKKVADFQDKFDNTPACNPPANPSTGIVPTLPRQCQEWQRIITSAQSALDGMGEVSVNNSPCQMIQASLPSKTQQSGSDSGDSSDQTKSAW